MTGRVVLEVVPVVVVGVVVVGIFVVLVVVGRIRHGASSAAGQSTPQQRMNSGSMFSPFDEQRPRMARHAMLRAFSLQMISAHPLPSHLSSQSL